MVDASTPEIGGGIVLEARSLEKRYGATRALADVSVVVRAGDVHAIMGENGAGKSTLVKVIGGLIPHGSYDGQLLVDGAPATFRTPGDAERAGVFLVPQEITIVAATTVAENLFLGHEPAGRGGVIDHAELLRRTRHWIDAFDIGVDPITPMRQLTSGQQQLVSIARAVSQGVRVLILDEPTASLSDADAERLFERIGELRERGVTTLYISHRMAEIGRLANHVTVMRDGGVVEEIDTVPGVDVSRRIVRSMVGHEIDELYPPRSVAIGDPALGVSSLTVANVRPGLPPSLEGIDLEIRCGEVLGVFGGVGSGAADLARALFGAIAARTRGTVSVAGAPVTIGSPRDAIDHGIGYLTADRKRDGLLARMSVVENLSLAVLQRLSPRQLVDGEREYLLATEYVDRLRIKTSAITQPIGQLSGGNQQKVLAAKWVATDPSVLIMEEPTRGIDVGARIDVYGLINELAAQGRAVLLVSSDLAEVIGMADRVIALNRGQVAGEWSADEATQRRVLAAATGGATDEPTR